MSWMIWEKGGLTFALHGSSVQSFPGATHGVPGTEPPTEDGAL